MSPERGSAGEGGGEACRPPGLSSHSPCASLRRLPSDGPLPLLLALLLYAPVGLCLLLVRLFVGLHVFLVSCALPDGAPRR